MNSSIYMTFSGLPLSVEMQWPFRESSGGADSLVLHGDVRLMDGSGLHALVSVSLSQTMKEVMPSLEASHAAPIVVNALRKDVERKQLEFLKSDKRQPVPLSSRFVQFRTKQFQFEKATDEQLPDFITRKVYWEAKMAKPNTWILDGCDVLYAGRTIEEFAKVALNLAEGGWITLNGEYAGATGKLLAQGEVIEKAAHDGFERLAQKHAFERA